MKKNNRLTIRFDKKEIAYLKALAKTARVPLSQLIRNYLLTTLPENFGERK